MGGKTGIVLPRKGTKQAGIWISDMGGVGSEGDGDWALVGEKGTCPTCVDGKNPSEMFLGVFDDDGQPVDAVVVFGRKKVKKGVK